MLDPACPFSRSPGRWRSSRNIRGHSLVPSCPTRSGSTLVPVSEGWDHAERVAGASTSLARILVSEVPEAVADEIFDPFGIPPHAVLEKWTRIGGARRKEMQAAWEADWAERHGRPYSRGGGPTKREDTEEPTRDERIAEATRSYSGPRTQTAGLAVLAKPPPTCRHPGHFRCGSRAGGETPAQRRGEIAMFEQLLLALPIAVYAFGFLGLIWFLQKL